MSVRHFYQANIDRATRLVAATLQTQQYPIYLLIDKNIATVLETNKKKQQLANYFLEWIMADNASYLPAINCCIKATEHSRLTRL